MKMKTILILGVAALFLSGCSHLFSSKNVAKDFDCAAAKGEGCRSIADIRSMIVTGGEQTAVHYNSSLSGYTGLGGTQVSVSGVPKWNSDVVLKIHVGTYVDNQGDYHDPSTMYIVARHGGWEVE